MRVNGLNSVSFSGRIIDAHAHTGAWKCPDGKIANFNAGNLDEFAKTPLNIVVGGVKQQDTVEKFIVSNLDCITNDGAIDELTGNKTMLDLCANNPKFYALAVCQPSKTNGNAKNIIKLINENPNKFVGLKFHPRGFGLEADSRDYRPYLKLAEKHSLPCLFHSDAPLDDAGKLIDRISSPQAIYNSAKEFPNVPVIMGHMGAGGAKSHQNAIDVLLSSIDKADAKLFVDLSWVDWGQDGLSSENKPSVVKLITELKKRNAMDRVIFGTDAPLGCFGEAPAGGLSTRGAYEKTVQDLKNVIKKNFGASADDIIDKIFYKNADDLFFQKKWNEVVQTVKNGPSTLKVIGVAFVCLAALTGIRYLFGNKAPSEKK